MNAASTSKSQAHNELVDVASLWWCSNAKTVLFHPKYVVLENMNDSIDNSPFGMLKSQNPCHRVIIYHSVRMYPSVASVTSSQSTEKSRYTSSQRGASRHCVSLLIGYFLLRHTVVLYVINYTFKETVHI